LLVGKLRTSITISILYARKRRINSSHLRLLLPRVKMLFSTEIIPFTLSLNLDPNLDLDLTLALFLRPGLSLSSCPFLPPCSLLYALCSFGYASIYHVPPAEAIFE